MCSPAVVCRALRCSRPALFLNGGTELPAVQGAGISVLTHAELQDWVSQALREVGAEAVSGEGSLDAVRAVHSEIFVRAVSKRREALLAAAVAEAALARGRAVFYTGGTIMAGFHAPRMGHAFNAAAYIARRAGAAVVSIDLHFPRGTWELHLEHAFPLLVVYGGADGPSFGHLVRRGHAVVPLPLPPGAGDESLVRVLAPAIDAAGEPLVVQLGFDIHRDDPTGYLFASELFFYELGRLLSGRAFFISVECPSTPSVFKRSIAALLAGLRGSEPPRVEPHKEGRKVVEEVRRVAGRARKLLERLRRRER